MPMYRKKPVVILARLIEPEKLEDLANWCGGEVAYTAPDQPPTGIDIPARVGMPMPVLDCVLHGHLGDYLIQGDYGEFYACEPEIFAARYECADRIPSPLFDFGQALLEMRLGARVRRARWNGKGMWIERVPATAWARLFGDTTTITNRPWIGMKDAQDGYIPWLASQADILAEDWELA
jgi:hypothetical protein